jgi:hypothetical protein
LTSSPPSEKREDSHEVWFGFNQNTFGRFLFHRSALRLAGTNGDGKPLHSEWTGKYDGKDDPVTGDPNVDTRSYKKVNDRIL